MKDHAGKAGAFARWMRGLAMLLWVVPGVVLAEASPPAPAPGDGPVTSEPLSLLVGELPLPFSYRVRHEMVSAGVYSLFLVTQRVELVPVDGPRAGRPITIHVRYSRSPYVPSDRVHGLAVEQAELYANDARTRSIEPLQSGGFGLTVADVTEKVEGEDDERLVRLFGNVDGGMLNIAIPDPEAGEGVSGMFGILRGLAVDYQRISRFPQRALAESKRSTEGGRILTVIGSLEPPEAFKPEVGSSDVTRDGTGKIIRARQSFYLRKRFQVNSLVVSCGLQRPTDEEDLELLRNPHGGEDSQVTILSRGGGNLGTLATQRIDFIQDDSRIRKGSYHYAEVGDGFVALGLFHISGRPQNEHLEAQLAKMDPVCRPESALLVDPAAEPAAADAAPDA